MLYSSRPHSRIRSHYQSLRDSQWTAALRLPSADKLWPSDYFTSRTVLLPMDTPPGIANTLSYLQHHLQELTKWQNALEHAINTTLVALTAQIQQITQLMTNPTPAPTIALSPIPASPSLVRPPSPALAALSKQRARPKLLSPPDFSDERSSRWAFLNSCTLYLCLALEQFTCNKEKIFWTLAFFKDGVEVAFGLPAEYW